MATRFIISRFGFVRIFVLDYKQTLQFFFSLIDRLNGFLKPPMYQKFPGIFYFYFHIFKQKKKHLKINQIRAGCFLKLEWCFEKEQKGIFLSLVFSLDNKRKKKRSF
jgi:hypothetical protein